MANKMNASSLMVAIVLMLAGCASSPARDEAREPSAKTRSREPWRLDSEFPGAKRLYERAEGQHVMRGYELPGVTKDPFLGPLLTTDVGPDLTPSLSMKDFYERRWTHADPRPGSSSRLISSDADTVVFEQRYDGPPSMPGVKFISVMRISRLAGQNRLAIVSYLAEAKRMSPVEIERTAGKLMRLSLY
jgi:hypothetical protein